MQHGCPASLLLLVLLWHIWQDRTAHTSTGLTHQLPVRREGEGGLCWGINNVKDLLGRLLVACAGLRCG